ncbi:MAG TPA: hypothetical protein VNZ01_03370, partial [Solirubrobacteraceae bacterium]|nr:hypothetical protein [Solirubrobacteraceae bacterium]
TSGRVTGAQRLVVVLALVGQHGPLVAAQFGVLLLEFLPGAPLAPQLPEVLGIPLVFSELCKPSCKVVTSYQVTVAA